MFIKLHSPAVFIFNRIGAGSSTWCPGMERGKNTASRYSIQGARIRITSAGLSLLGF